MLLIFSATPATQPRPGTTRSTRWRVSPSSSRSRSDQRSSCRSIRSPWVALAAQGERLFISSLRADSEDRLGAESRSLLSQQTDLACILHEIGERGRRRPAIPARRRVKGLLAQGIPAPSG